MNRKGFTLVELLTAIVIIAVLSGIAVISYQSYISRAEEKYYETLESNIALAGNDYFEDHREKLPIGTDYSEVSLLELISARYIDQVVDSKGNACNEGTVFAYRENDKYQYEVCLNNCGNHESQGRYCVADKPNSRINISSSTYSGKEYDVLKSYNSQEYSIGEDISVSLEVSDKYNISRYVITNTNGDEPITCTTEGSNACSINISKTGTYKVVAYEDDKTISTRYFSAKIAKGTPSFILDGDEKYIIDKISCNSGTKTTKVTVNIVKQNDNEYKSIMYQVKRYQGAEIATVSEWKEPRGLTIEETLESGHYDIQVVVVNYSSEEENEQISTISFDVAYVIDLEYEDGSSSGTHEVVKDQTYNFLSANGNGEPLPETNPNSLLAVRWYKNDARIYPDVNTVIEDCTYKLVGKSSIVVPLEDIINSNYCKDENELKYTGNEITLTNEAPDHITFINNRATSLGSHTVNVKIEQPNYIWSDGTITDKEFVCTIVKGDNPIEIVDNQTWETTYSTSAKNYQFTPATNAAGAVTYSIVSQTPGTYFSIPTSSASTITMAASTPKGSYTIVVRATAVGNEYFNSGYKDINLSVSIGVTTNPMMVTSPQSWETTYSTSAQTHSFTGASNAQGSVTYAILSQPSGNYFSIPNNGTASIQMKASTPAGSYEVEINATAAGNANYANKTSKIVMNVTVNPQACSKPSDVAVSTSGIVTWTGSSNCSGATYQIKVGDGLYESATSGVDKNSDITVADGSIIVYVKTVAPNGNYSDSEAELKSVNVYKVTLTKGAGISDVSGAGKYISGATVTLGATVDNNYTWKNWSNLDGTSISSTIVYQATISSDWSYKANTKTYKKGTQACTEGNYKVAVTNNVSSDNCTAITKGYADKHNTNKYVTCVATSSTDPNTGHTVYYKIRTEYSRYSCKTYSSSVTYETGLTSCSESSNKNYKYTCIEE